ncbi:MAG: response regulator transcription factor, partial [Gammaproteobacteria bacterium]|nr:response regulator transcription factor [Gammaproteobacteria bacterium]
MKVLLIDDHSLFRDGMQLVLNNLDENIQMLSASSYEDALPLMQANIDLDLVLLDLGLPGLSD